MPWTLRVQSSVPVSGFPQQSAAHAECRAYEKILCLRNQLRCQSERRRLCWIGTRSLNLSQLIEDEKHYKSKAFARVPCKVTSCACQCWFYENAFSLLSGRQYHAILTALWERDVTVSGERWRSQRPSVWQGPPFWVKAFYNWAMFRVWGFCMTSPTKWQPNATDPTSSPQETPVDLCFVLEACEYFNKTWQERTAAPSSMSSVQHGLLGTSPAFNLASLITYDSTCW